MIQALNGGLTPSRAGFTLCHEHVYAEFGAATGDPDLEFSDSEAIGRDLTAANAAGVRTLVEVTTADMRPDLREIARLADRAGLQVVKSVGWFRSPTADSCISGRPVSELADRLVVGLTEGLEGADGRAGCLGEIGVTGVAPTVSERRNLDATAAAAIATGAGIICHTDDHPNALTLMSALLDRGVAPGRLLLGHARVDDPLGWQAEMIGTGVTLAFDQLGHPRRDPVGAVCARILELLERGATRIALSADVGRRSRLTAHGGEGYVGALTALLAQLRARGVGESVLDGLVGGNVAGFLSFGMAR
jgi:phosphotriesterase-related protein